MIWGNLLHLSYNMWGDWDHPTKYTGGYWGTKPFLRFDEEVWNTVLARMVEAGMNMVVIDLGDAIQYESHPEIAVEGAWSIPKLKSELAKLRQMGLEPIPKLNFSTTHDVWLGEVARCVSTPRYYQVCGDLIAEVVELFDKPRFFHLGMDEETAEHQVNFIYVVSRQFDLWWNDLLFLVEQVEKAGSRAWIWSDHIWYLREEFLAKMPPSVVQSNWYYWDNLDPASDHRVQAYFDLQERGFDQIPTASIWKYRENFSDLAAFCRKRLSPDHLLGFLQTPWQPTKPEFLDDHMKAIDVVAEAMKECRP